MPLSRVHETSRARGCRSLPTNGQYRDVTDDESKGSTSWSRSTPTSTSTDNAREALDFYHSVFGGELTTSTFAEYGQADDPADADKVMHGQLESGTASR